MSYSFQRQGRSIPPHRTYSSWMRRQFEGGDSSSDFILGSYPIDTRFSQDAQLILPSFLSLWNRQLKRTADSEFFISGLISGTSCPLILSSGSLFESDSEDSTRSYQGTQPDRSQGRYLNRFSGRGPHAFKRRSSGFRGDQLYLYRLSN